MSSNILIDGNSIPAEYKTEPCFVHSIEDDGFSEMCGSCLRLAEAKMLGAGVHPEQLKGKMS